MIFCFGGSIVLPMVPNVIVGQRSCEPARLRIDNCLSVLLCVFRLKPMIVSLLLCETVFSTYQLFVYPFARQPVR